LSKGDQQVNFREQTIDAELLKDDVDDFGEKRTGLVARFN
jgi:hypothetical protein